MLLLRLFLFQDICVVDLHESTLTCTHTSILRTHIPTHFAISLEIIQVLNFIHVSVHKQLVLFTFYIVKVKATDFLTVEIQQRTFRILIFFFFFFLGISLDVDKLVHINLTCV